MYHHRRYPNLIASGALSLAVFTAAATALETRALAAPHETGFAAIDAGPAPGPLGAACAERAA